MYIYLIENIENNMWYIGKRMKPINSTDYEKYYGSGVRIIKAIKKYGKNKFRKSVLEICDNKEHLADREIYWIKKFILENKNETYNVLLERNYIGRQCGFKQSREHISNRVKSTIKSGGYIWTDERREKFSQYRKTVQIWNKGIKCNSISKSKMGCKNPMAKKVIDLSNGKKFETLKDASKFYNIKYATLYQYLIGTRKNKTTLFFI
jgi:hypothetical protein